LLERVEVILYGFIKPGRPTRAKEVTTKLRAEHETRGHGQAEILAHLDEACSLAAEELTKLGRRALMDVVKAINHTRVYMTCRYVTPMLGGCRTRKP
jgi:hypothetical protein